MKPLQLAQKKKIVKIPMKTKQKKRVKMRVRKNKKRKKRVEKEEMKKMVVLISMMTYVPTFSTFLYV